MRCSAHPSHPWARDERLLAAEAGRDGLGPQRLQLLGRTPAATGRPSAR